MLEQLTLATHGFIAGMAIGWTVTGMLLARGQRRAERIHRALWDRYVPDRYCSRCGEYIRDKPYSHLRECNFIDCN